MLKPKIFFVVGLASICHATVAVAERISFKDGRVVEAPLSYYDPEEVCTSAGDGVEVCFKRSSIRRISPQTRPLVSGAWKSEELGIQLQAPGEWTVLSADVPSHRQLSRWQEGQLVRFYRYPFKGYANHPQGYEPSPGWLNPSLSVITESAKGYGSEVEYAKARLQLLSQMPGVKDFHLIQMEDMYFINGRPWFRLAVDYQYGALHLRSEDYFLLTKGRIYWLSAVDKAANFQANQPAFDAAIQSCEVQ